MSEQIDWGKPGPQMTLESFGPEPSLQTIVVAFYSDRIPDQDLAENTATEYMEGFKPAGGTTDEEMNDLMGDGSWLNTTGKHFADMFTTDAKGDEEARLAREANTA